MPGYEDKWNLFRMFFGTLDNGSKKSSTIFSVTTRRSASLSTFIAFLSLKINFSIFALFPNTRGLSLMSLILTESNDFIALVAFQLFFNISPFHRARRLLLLLEERLLDRDLLRDRIYFCKYFFSCSNSNHVKLHAGLRRLHLGSPSCSIGCEHDKHDCSCVELHCQSSMLRLGHSHARPRVQFYRRQHKVDHVSNFKRHRQFTNLHLIAYLLIFFLSLI